MVKLEDTKSSGSIEPIKGSIAPLSFDGGEEPLVVLAKKINELIDKVNKNG